MSPLSLTHASNLHKSRQNGIVRTESGWSGIKRQSEEIQRP